MNYGTLVPALEVVYEMVQLSRGSWHSVELCTRDFREYPGSSKKKISRSTGP